jgi:hypothetical protein
MMADVDKTNFHKYQTYSKFEIATQIYSYDNGDMVEDYFYVLNRYTAHMEISGKHFKHSDGSGYDDSYSGSANCSKLTNERY